MSRGEKSITQFTVDCVRLPAFNANDFDAIQHVFATAQPIRMGQAWRQQEEAHFAEGLVRVGWYESALLVFAELMDADIFTRATILNQRLWALGDSFEIFLQPIGQSAYTELQVAPNNCRLQLRYPNPQAVDEARTADDFTSYLISGDAFSSATWVKPTEGKWFVFTSIPKDLVCEKREPIEGRQWRFSFSRYDYTSGRVLPVVSSTSPHTKPEFHSQKEWGTMRFVSAE